MIRQGAALVTSVQEIAEEIGLPETVPTTDGTAIEVSSAPVPSDEMSAQILKTIAVEPRQLDEIVVLTRGDSQRVSQCLMELQLSGFVRQDLTGIFACPHTAGEKDELGCRFNGV